MMMEYVKIILQNRIQHYNHKKYWKYREKFCNPNNSCISKYLCIYRIKRMDAFNNASMGTNFDKSAIFKTPPILPHGLNGIIVSQYASIGKNVTIYHQVTIGAKEDKYAPIIGDNVIIYPKSILIGDIHIGDNVIIGAGSVVVKDIPDNSIAVGNPARIIKRKEN